MKLFWKEIREDLIPPHVGKTIWDEIPAAIIDTQKLEHLFESRAKDTISKVQKPSVNVFSDRFYGTFHGFFCYLSYFVIKSLYTLRGKTDTLFK